MQPPTWSRLIFGALLSMIPTAIHANRYTLVDLGRATTPTAINATGNVAGMQRPKGKSGQAAVWRGGQWHHLGWRPSIAESINGRGDLAGWSDGQFGSVPVFWPRRQKARTVALPNGAQFGGAWGLSQDRTIVGEFADPSTGQAHCFMTGADGSSLDLGLMPGGDACLAYSVNGSHQVVGGANLVPLGSLHPFVWQDGVFQDLVLPGGAWGLAEAINFGGDVVGFSAASNGQIHAFLWGGGSLQDIGTDPQWLESYAWSINDSGEIVGEADNNTASTAVRFAGGQIVELATEVDGLGDWTLEYAAAISNAGVIVGVGMRPHHEDHAFMLVPEDAPGLAQAAGATPWQAAGTAGRPVHRHVASRPPCTATKAANVRRCHVEPWAAGNLWSQSPA